MKERQGVEWTFGLLPGNRFLEARLRVARAHWLANLDAGKSVFWPRRGRLNRFFGLY